MDCPFCAIVRGDAPASLIAETGLAVAFVGFRQVVPGHVLVVPRTHVEDVYGLDPDVAGEVMTLAVRVARAVRAAFDPPGLNLWQSNGDAGGQEVAHFICTCNPGVTMTACCASIRRRCQSPRNARCWIAWRA